MTRWTIVLALVGAVPMGVLEPEEAAAQSYQRRREDRRPQHGHRDGRRPRPAPAPSVAAGSFQRPYPYHLDYYKQRYGGTYEPYFGNLYGPPNVVLGAPYGAYGYYPGYPPQGYAPQGYPAGEAAPWGPPPFHCPHCGELIEFGAPQGDAPPDE